MKNISILGSTGSIGTQTLEICKETNAYNILGLTCNKNTKLLNKQINLFNATYFHSNKAMESKAKNISPKEIAVDKNMNMLVVATEGLSSLEPTIKALNNSKIVGVANKETLLCGYEFILNSINTNKGKLIPLDSEPASLKNLLAINNKKINKLIITASGGPFRDKNINELSEISPKEALNHPTWKMGKKISVDSATLMNKAFEVLECSLLFNYPTEKIEVIINPKSDIHALIEYEDNSIIASHYPPDMKIPISEFLSGNISAKSKHILLSQKDLKKPDFEKFDPQKYPAYEIGMFYGNKRGSWIIALCASDQAAVDLFLQKKIKFTDIPKLIEYVLQKHIESEILTINDIYKLYNSTINQTHKVVETKWK